jgi:hypothetical protein
VQQRRRGIQAIVDYQSMAFDDSTERIDPKQVAAGVVRQWAGIDSCRAVKRRESGQEGAAGEPGMKARDRDDWRPKEG